MNTKLVNARMYCTASAEVCTLLALVLTVVIPRSDAGIIFHATDVTSSFLGGEANLTGYTAWQIDVSTDNGDFITAVDIAFGGPFHQRIDFGFDGLPGTTAIGAAANGRGDSHLTPGADALFAVAPAEDFNVASSPLPADDAGNFEFGVGSYLYGAWGIPGDRQTTRTSLAYLVLPDGAIDSLVYDLSIATRSGTSNNQPSGLSQGDLPEVPGRPVAQPIPPGVLPTAPNPTPSAPDDAVGRSHDSTPPGEACHDPSRETSRSPGSEGVLPDEDPPAGIVHDDGNGERDNGYDRESNFRIDWGTIHSREIFVGDFTAIPADLSPLVYFTGTDGAVLRPGDAGSLAVRGVAEVAPDGELLFAGSTLPALSATSKRSIPEPASGLYIAGIAAWVTNRRRRR